MTETYYLKASIPGARWAKVSKEDFIIAERRAGFRPKMSSDHPEYMNTLATGGFGGNGLEGKIERGEGDDA